GEPVEMWLLRRAVDGMLARRGRPGSGPHAALRARQATVAAAPTHHALALVAAERLADLPPGDGIADPDRLLGPALGRELPAALGERRALAPGRRGRAGRGARHARAARRADGAWVPGDGAAQPDDPGAVGAVQGRGAAPAVDGGARGGHLHGRVQRQVPARGE